METRNGESESPPLLMISYGESLEKHAIYNPSEERFSELNFSALEGKKVLGSIYGWLVLVEPVNNDYYGDCCLFNPIAEDVIDLPKLHDSMNYDQCILTKPPTEPDCYILFNGLEQSFCRIGEKEYVTRTLMQQEEEEKANDHAGFDDLLATASFQGNAYGYMDYNKLVAINFVGNTIEFTQIPMVELRVTPHSSISHSGWLIEPEKFCGGESLLVQKLDKETDSYKGFDFKVYRVDVDQMKCIEILNIGNRTIFVSEDGAGFCCRSSAGIKPNSIYYTNEDDENLYVFDMEVFDLEDRSTSLTMLSDYGVEDDEDHESIRKSWVQHNIFK